MSDPFRRRATALLVVLVALGLSWLVREAHHRRESLPRRDGWVTTDPDSLYHVRRVARVLEEGQVAGIDPYLSSPEGARVPWPPYYTRLVAGVLAPFAPEEPEARRAWLEMRVSSLPLVFGVMTSCIAAIAAMRLAGASAGLAAGAYHALCLASYAYSKSGNGDHHAYVSLLQVLMLLLLSEALARRALDRPRAAIAFGAALGLVAGVAIGSWVGSLLYVMEVELVLGWLLVKNGTQRIAGLAPFGLAFHLAALFALAPAVLASPWKDELPWMVINLSWFHLAFLATGAAVFVPLSFVHAGSRAARAYPWAVGAGLGAIAALLFAIDVGPAAGIRAVFVPLSFVHAGSRAARAYPWAVGAGLGAIAALLFAIDVGPAAGIRAGFEWVSRADAFMATVRESDALLGDGAGLRIFETLGLGVVLLPFAWAAIAFAVLRKDERALLPWVVAVPILFVQAARQARFADALAAPMAVVLAVGTAQLLRRSGEFRRRLDRVPSLALGLLAVLAAVAGQALAVASTARRLTGEPTAPGIVTKSQRAMRLACEWLRKNAPSDTGESVLAFWDGGHVIEWAADRPSVATNFGSYVGLESFLDPSRFFTSEDPHEAEELLERRAARFVLLTSLMPNELADMVEAVCPERRSRYMTIGRTGKHALLPAWLATMGGRLLFDGADLTGADPHPLGFLRLAYVTPMRDTRPALSPRGAPLPVGWLWERVAGAVVEARGAPGQTLSVSLTVRFTRARYALVFTDTAVADENGVARVRVPYSTEPAPGRVIGAAQWSMGERNGTLAISEADVRAGRTVRL